MLLTMSIMTTTIGFFCCLFYESGDLEQPRLGRVLQKLHDFYQHAQTYQLHCGKGTLRVLHETKQNRIIRKWNITQQNIIIAPCSLVSGNEYL